MTTKEAKLAWFYTGCEVHKLGDIESRLVYVKAKPEKYSDYGPLEYYCIDSTGHVHIFYESEIGDTEAKRRAEQLAFYPIPFEHLSGLNLSSTRSLSYKEPDVIKVVSSITRREELGDDTD